MRGLFNRRTCCWGTVVILGLLTQPLWSAEAGNGTVPWRTDFSAALAEAEQTGKPLLVHFYAIWCGPCAKMERDILKSPEVKKLLSDRVIGVKIDSDRHPELVQRYSVQFLPSDPILDPANGKVLIELQTDPQRAMDRNTYLSFAASGERRFQQAQSVRIAAKQKAAEHELAKNSAVAPEGNGSKPASVELGEPKLLLGLDGFSPVSLTKHRKWIRGTREFTWVYQGVPYQMANADEWKAFRADPESYAPRLLGCDPVILSDSDRAVAGRTKFGAFYNDELYFFANADNRKRFKANPQRFIKTQHVLKADQIDRTAMLEDETARN
ncbi:MAG: thioredoxin family protein [Planctomycetaceae bacterium]